ncbi:zinc-binding alcohol dehydrogenase family protein [Mucilaginibacter sp. RS28]|uniref:Zinc-binding alcohol dehydrogenase family protein n=1 Tax=Mucilaginibacter straminoryzae TaxID=2932774 RepID=A0A9X1X079_9SPHI|nr:zinc-binding alcohol dehydrogenase family protein [Mucilaginibacter straminoryzae]MCJ8208643.1 zinc-binding alcohol dehydrogenase family protein [Mucilaginibacter straminoryzae]
MRTIICETPGTLKLQETQAPELQPGNVLIKIKRIGVCGTDLHAFEGTQPFFSYPRVLGHELSGEIVDTGDVAGFEKGELVTFIPYFNCGHCVACRADKPNCCANIKVFGVHIDGGMAEYVQIPQQYLLKSEGLSLDELALVEPFAIGAHGIKRAALQAGEFVLIMGVGPIGLTMIEMASGMGANVIAADVNDERLAFCNENFKVTATLNTLKDDVIARLHEITNGDMPTVIIDATGNQKAINSAFYYLAHGGRYVLVGLQKGDLIVSHPEFHKRESTLMSSRNATKEDFAKVISLMKSGEINPRKFITHNVGFEMVPGEFSKLLDPANKVIKALITI